MHNHRAADVECFDYALIFAQFVANPELNDSQDLLEVSSLRFLYVLFVYKTYHWNADAIATKNISSLKNLNQWGAQVVDLIIQVTLRNIYVEYKSHFAILFNEISGWGDRQIVRLNITDFLGPSNEFVGNLLASLINEFPILFGQVTLLDVGFNADHGVILHCLFVYALDLNLTVHGHRVLIINLKLTLI